MSTTKQQTVRGKVYVLGDNVDTDQIIPAQYLNLVPTIPEEYEKLGSYALSGLPESLPAFVPKGKMRSEFAIVIGGRNFGCGSSREHAPVALGAAGVQAVVAESYARIFFRNAVATGELFPCESQERLCETFLTGAEAELDIQAGTVTDLGSGKVFRLKPLGAVAPVIEAGGIFAYARAAGMIAGPSQAESNGAQRAKPRTTRVFAVANQKGGVGKTTTAVNLASCLAKTRKRVLLLDMDPQANASSALGLQQTDGGSIYKMLLGEGELAEQARNVRTCLDVIPAEVDLAGAEVDIARSEKYLHRLRTALAPLIARDRYDYVIIDCPPSLGILTMNALAAAEYLVVPVQCEYFALEGLSVMSRLVNQMRASGANPALAIDGILMTMYDGRTNLSQQVVDEVRKHLGAKVYRTVIPRSVRLSEAPSHGLPIDEYDKSSTGAKAYQAFAREFLRRRGRVASGQ